MIVYFEDRYFQSLYENFPSRRGKQEFPPEVLKKYVRIIGYMRRAVDLNELRLNYPGLKMHELTSDRDSQKALWVNDKYRIVFRTEIAEFPDGTGAQVIVVIELIDYHG